MTHDAKPIGARLDSGPACYRNWTAKIAGSTAWGGSEVPLYSDCFIVGEVSSLGPYSIVHASPESPSDPAFVLRCTSYFDPNMLPGMSKTDTSGYTGARLADEIAALLSLSLGARVMAGATTRLEIEPNKWLMMGDRNRPIAMSPSSSRGPVLPRACEKKTLTADPISSLPQLSPGEATALIRAARCYRDAVWIAEAEPELAWLLMVSALEVAAVQQKAENTEPVEILRESKPELVARLAQAGSTLLEEVAQSLARELRATARFLDFVERFLPEAPKQRPPRPFQLEWSPRAMRKFMTTIYRYRSDALHEGIPFPPPMCDPPGRLSDGDAPVEGFHALAAATTGGVWTKKDLPMSLHTFEHVARGALLSWWRKLGASNHVVRSP